MKTRKNIYFKVVALAAIAIAFAMPAKAQLSDNGYANIDWQFNVPLGNHFADKSSGWGMNFEGGYFVTPNIGLGLFLNYHTNHEYVGRETFQLGAGEVTTDQQHTMFQLPFGAAARYQWNRGGSVQPYVSAKLVPSMLKSVPTSICSKQEKTVGASTLLLKSVSTYFLGYTDRDYTSLSTTAMVPTRLMYCITV